MAAIVVDFGTCPECGTRYELSHANVEENELHVWLFCPIGIPDNNAKEDEDEDQDQDEDLSEPLYCDNNEAELLRIVSVEA